MKVNKMSTMKLKFEADVIKTNDIEHDIVRGYVDPHKFLQDGKQAQQVKEAIEIIQQFTSTLDGAGLIEDLNDSYY